MITTKGGERTVAKLLRKLGYYWVDTTYDDDFIYDIYENNYGQRKAIIIGVR